MTELRSLYGIIEPACYLHLVECESCGGEFAQGYELEIATIYTFALCEMCGKSLYDNCLDEEAQPVEPEHATRDKERAKSQS